MNRLVIVRDLCPGCGYQPPNGLDVRVTSIQAKEAAWIASGRIDAPPGYCAVCGQSLEAILREVPIQCAKFTCPNCHNAEHLSFQVKHIDNEALDFSVMIECKICQRKRSLSKAFKKMLSLVKISVGPVGISAKEKAASAD